MKKLFAAFVLASTTVVSQAGVFWTGNQLYQKMGGDTHEYLEAMSYIKAVSDVLVFGDSYCPPTVTGKQVFDVTQKWMSETRNPDTCRQQFWLAVALGKAWPCAAKPNANGGKQL